MPDRNNDYEAWRCYHGLKKRYRDWMIGSVEKTAGRTALEESSKIDIGILDWTISALGDDDSLEKFIEAIPGFFHSKLVKDLPDDISRRLSDALDGFLDRTLSSNAVIDSDKFHRLDIFMNAINFLHVSEVSSILRSILFDYWDPLPHRAEIGHTLAHWCTNNDQRTAVCTRHSFQGPHDCAGTRWPLV
jgi:hypothetical protein